jgi:ABC-type nickel/cobalt efflux system permease component RcnA
MKPRFIIVIFLIYSLLPLISFAQGNPLISKKESKSPRESTRYPNFLQKILKPVYEIQRNLNRNVSKLAREIKEKKSKRSFFLIILATFIYGMIHAAGPGHGKTIIFSYFISRNAKIKKGILVGSFIGFMHALSALTIVLALHFIIKQSFLQTFEDIDKVIKIISYSLISLIGLFLLVKAIMEASQKKGHKEFIIKKESEKNIIPFVIAVGIIPCPGAMIILLFSLSLGFLAIGVVSTLFMALGMAATISAVGILTILAKERVLKFFSQESKLRKPIQSSLAILGATFILLLGIFMLSGTI